MLKNVVKWSILGNKGTLFVENITFLWSWQGAEPPLSGNARILGAYVPPTHPLLQNKIKMSDSKKVQTPKSMKFWTGRYWLFYVWSILSQNIAAAAWFPIEMHLPRIPLRLRNKLSDRFSDHTPVLQRIQWQTKAMTIEDSDKWWKSIPFYTWHRGPPWSQCSYIDTIWH